MLQWLGSAAGIRRISQEAREDLAAKKDRSADFVELPPVDPDKTPDVRLNPTIYWAEVNDIAASRVKRGIGDEAKNAEWLEKLAEATRGDDTYSEAFPQSAPEDWKPPVSMGLMGLALSGGGIRSSTFCLGLLQSLGECRVLRHVDYLSTVSGGGYIGSFWSCLLARSRIADKGQPKPLCSDERFQSNPLFLLDHRFGTEEDPAMQRLRNFANYLAPHGVVDWVRFPMLILRGMVINFLMVLPYVLFLAAATVWLFRDEIRSPVPVFGPAMTPVLAALLVFGLVFGGVVQSRKRSSGHSSRKLRRRILAWNTAGLLLVLLVALIDYQPYLIHWLRRPAGGYQTYLTDPVVWTVVSGAFSAFFSSGAAARNNPRAARLGLWLVGVLGPLAFVALYIALCRFAAFTPNAELLPWPAVYFLAGAVLWVFSIFCFDVNATSLHNFYRDSLSRTFLFSRHVDEAAAASETHEQDEITLSDIDIRQSGGPYHLLNAAWNNPNLDERSLRGRRSDFFVFGPRYTGNNRLGYCPTRDLEAFDVSANLGTALAVSAAAAAPVMGQKTPNPFLVFLMAMLNVRLGYWLPAPKRVNEFNVGKKGRKWHRQLQRSPSRPSYFVGPVYFLAELFGLPDRIKGWKAINLSDGGHIENLGVFQLLRRRCRFIIAVDAEADPQMTFNGLATLIRLARTDLGVDIDIDVHGLRKDDSGLSRRHWVLGTIHYGDGAYGEFLYIKASVTGSENEYINEYRAKNPAFPHESTGDQFFDEVQFEAYRALGYKVGKSLLYRAVDREQLPGFEKEGPYKLFDDLRNRETDLVLRPAIFSQLQDLRRDIETKLTQPDLNHYATEEMFFESDFLGLAGKARQAEVSEAAAAPREASDLTLYQVCNAKLQLMEQAIYSLRLDDPRNRSRKSNRGWMNLFRRWSYAESFQRMWAVSIWNYGTSLQVFCQEELQLTLDLEWVSPPPEFRFTRAEKIYLGGDSGLEQHRKAGSVFVARLAGSRAQRHKAGKFPVAVALCELRDGKRFLTRFRVRDTYRGEGLRELLLDSLGHREIFDGCFLFDLPRSTTDEYDDLVSVLRRTGWQHPDDNLVA